MLPILVHVNQATMMPLMPGPDRQAPQSGAEAIQPATPLRMTARRWHCRTLPWAGTPRNHRAARARWLGGCSTEPGDRRGGGKSIGSSNIDTHALGGNYRDRDAVRAVEARSCRSRSSSSRGQQTSEPVQGTTLGDSSPLDSGRNARPTPRQGRLGLLHERVTVRVRPPGRRLWS
jgi:hypothetical protein